MTYRQHLLVCLLLFGYVATGLAKSGCPPSSGSSAKTIEVGPAHSNDYLVDFGLREPGQQITFSFAICNTSTKDATLDVFSLGESIVAYWAQSDAKSRPSTRVTLGSGQARRVEAMIQVQTVKSTPFFAIEDQGKLLGLIFLEILVNDQQSSLPLQATIKQLQSGWINQKNDPPYRICVDDPPPYYRSSQTTEPVLKILNARSSNGDSHPRDCKNQWAACSYTIVNDNVCYDVAVEGHVKYQQLFTGGDETDFVWFDLELTAWYERFDRDPEWIELLRDNGAARVGR